MAGPGSPLREVSSLNDKTQVQAFESHEGLADKLQREGNLLGNGIASGFSNRVQEAKENWGTTAVEVATSVGLGAGLMAMSKAGGAWGTAAKVGMWGFGAMFAGDIVRRAIPTAGAMADTWHSAMNLEENKQVVGRNLGSAFFDYPVMMAGGAVGAGAVKFGPSMINALGRGVPLELAARPQMAFATVAGEGAEASRFAMRLGEHGSLGATEKVSDPFESFRERITRPNQQKFQSFSEMKDIMAEREIAKHPEIAPTRQQMIESLAKVDELKPVIAKESTSLTALDSQIAKLKAMSDEVSAVTSAERRIASLKADEAALPGKKDQLSALQEQLKALKNKDTAPGEADGGKDAAKKGGKDKAPKVDPEALRTQASELRSDIQGAESRLKGRGQAEQDLAEAIKVRDARKAQIEAGSAQDINDLEAKAKPLRESLASHQGELDALHKQLSGLNDAYSAKAQEVMPGVGAGISNAPEPTVKTRPVENRGGGQRVKSSGDSEAGNGRSGDHGQNRNENRSFQNSRRGNDGNEGRQSRDGRNERSAQDRQVKAETNEAPKGVTEKDVNESLKSAQKAVDEFATRRVRHTNALKGINDYIGKTFELWAVDATAADTQAGQTLANVEGMLKKVDNWQKPSSWFRPADKAALMQRNGFDAAQMGKFDAWYDEVGKPFQSSSNSSAASRLNDIQQHLEHRVAVESVKHYLQMRPDIEAGVSPIVQKGFETVASGKLPDGKPIPQGSDMIVFEQKNVNGQDVVAPFAKVNDKGQFLQRFDMDKIQSGLAKRDAILQGPSALSGEDLYGFRLDHDPSRLIGSGKQVGYAILRPGGQYGKNVLFMEGLTPEGMRMDSTQGAGTNTGVIYNLLRRIYTSGSKGAVKAAPVEAAAVTPKAGDAALPGLEIK